MTITIGSLFSGIGGIEKGLEDTGDFKTIWFVENNQYCKAVLQTHWEDTPVYDDIRNINWTELERPDILTGGFPCQDISNAGQREGITGSRSSLWKEYLKAIRILRPKIALIENVSALALRGLHIVLADLASLGYDAQWQDLRASDLGARHKRERLFIIAIANPSSIRCEQGTSQGANNQAREWNVHAGGQQGCEVGSRPNNSSVNVANAECERCQDNETNRVNKLYSRYGKELLESFRTTTGRAQWQTEPAMGRLVNGTARGLDSYLWRESIKALGNAVVPQCAQFLAPIIKHHLRHH